MAWHTSPSTPRMNPTPPSQDPTNGCCTSNHFEVAGDRVEMVSKCIVGLFWGDKFAAMLEIRSPITVPQYTLKPWLGLTFIREGIIFHDD